MDAGNSRRINYIVGYAAEHAAGRGVDRLRILDLGCGVGNISFALLQAGHEVTGVDLDDDSISYCREHSSFDRATFTASDIETLALGQRFEMVVCSEVLEHLPHPGLALGVIERHLEDGGLLIVTTPNGWSLWEQLICRLAQGMRRWRLGSMIYGVARRVYFLAGEGRAAEAGTYNMKSGHINFFSFWRLTGMLSRNGLDIVSREKQGLITSIPPLRRIDRWARAEDALAQVLPPALCGWWGLVALKRRVA